VLDYGWVENPRILVMRHQSKKKQTETPMLYVRQQGAVEPLLLPLGESMKLYVTSNNIIEVRSNVITNMLFLVVPD
jgi:chaperonin GroEL (HSP60 family)